MVRGGQMLLKAIMEVKESQYCPYTERTQHINDNECGINHEKLGNETCIISCQTLSFLRKSVNIPQPMI